MFPNWRICHVFYLTGENQDEYANLQRPKIWEFYERSPFKDHAKCLSCSRILRTPKNSTRSLHRHLQRFHVERWQSYENKRYAFSCKVNQLMKYVFDWNYYHLVICRHGKFAQYSKLWFFSGIFLYTFSYNFFLEFSKILISKNTHFKQIILLFLVNFFNFLFF